MIKLRAKPRHELKAKENTALMLDDKDVCAKSSRVLVQ